MFTIRSDRRRFLGGAVAFAGALVLPNRVARAQTPVATDAALATFADPEATGEQLVNAWFALLSTTGDAAGTEGSKAERDARAAGVILPTLDPAFQLQRAAGERYVLSSYVPTDIEEFALENVRETRPSDDLMVVRYSLRAPGTTADTSVVLSDELLPRLTVFHRDPATSQWRVLSHANFNIPISTICGATPLAPSLNPTVPTSAEDIALGVSLIEAAAAAAVAGDTLPVLDPQIQVQTAAGYGYTTTAERPGETKLERSKLSDMLVTRNDNAIVVSFRGRASGEVNEVEMADQEQPRLITFRLNEEGEWKAIATAYFSTLATIPEGVDCADVG
jgi:hypothetical protein